MRALLLMLAACGPPLDQRQLATPAPATVAEQHRPVAIVRDAAPIDVGDPVLAAILVDAPPAPERSGHVSDYVTISEEAKPQAPIEETANDDLDARIENGVIVGTTKLTVWCVSSGKFPGMCVETLPKCKKIGSGCTKHIDYSCFSFTSRTTGSDTELCFVDYRTCQRAHALIGLDDETASENPCAIFRHKAK